MQARWQARVPDHLEAVYFDAQKMQMGLGAAAVGGWESLGDALVVGGRVWLRTTHPSSPRYYRLVSNRYFQSNAFVYVPKGRANENAWHPEPGMTFAQAWKALAGKYPRGVVAAGYVRARELRTIAISHPATNQLPISKNAARYYTHPMESVPDAWAYVVGVIARGARTSRGRDGVTWAWVPPFANPYVVSYAHALRLQVPPKNMFTPPRPDNITAVGQLVGDTIIAEGALMLYPVTRAAVCTDAVYPTSANRALRN